MSDGFTNRQIAERLFVSARTAEFHVEQIRNKLGIHSRGEIAAWLAAQGGSAPPSTLPPELTKFVGRSSEIASIRTLLAQTRLVTIAGTGGVGKTRLAIAVANRVVEDFPDGAWFVDLQGLADPELVPGEVAASLEVENLDALRGRRHLVVLDSCEQVIVACAAVAKDLLASCPALRILATSRQPLEVPGEAVWSLQPLPATEAAELFLDRAGLAAPDVDLMSASPALVDSICRDLDGIPLAIELAAARARVMSLSDIRERLRDRFGLLTGGTSGNERQRTLESTVDWSYGLLTDAERLLFRRLGVFAGAFLLDSVEAVVVDHRLAQAQVPDLLGRLVDRSLVVARRSPDRSTRYRLLATMRDYARERLRNEDALDDLRTRHAHRFRTLAVQAGTGLEGPEQAIWFRRLEDEIDEIRFAAEWALEREPETALILAGELCWFWGLGGRTAEGRVALAAALPRAPAVTVIRGRALIAAGWLARLQSDNNAGLALHTESVEVLRQFDDPLQLGMAEVWKAEAAMTAGDPQIARLGWEEAVALLEPIGTSQPLAYAFLELSSLDLADGQPGLARARATRSAAMNEQLHNPRAQALAKMVLGYADHLEGRSAAGLESVRECIRQLYDCGAVGDLQAACTAAALMTIPAGGSAARAVTLAAAAEMIALATGRNVHPWKAELEAAVASARAGLGELGYEAARSRGSVMTVEEAVAHLLGDFG